MAIAKITQRCASHPLADEAIGQLDSPVARSRTHECLAAEMRCAYCGVRLAPYPCNGCGRFLTAKQMHEAGVDGEPWRCDDCA
jgi:hypothetical protein